VTHIRKQGIPPSGAASVALALAGSGGAGVMTAGNMLLEAAAAAGLYGLMVRSSGPQIRGGEAAALLRFSSQPLDNLGDRFDFLVAIDWQNVHRFADEIPLDAGSLIVGDPDQGAPPEGYTRSGAATRELAMKKIAKSIPGSWPNMVALGLAAVVVLLGQQAPMVGGGLHISTLSRCPVAASRRPEKRRAAAAVSAACARPIERCSGSCRRRGCTGRAAVPLPRRSWC